MATIATLCQRKELIPYQPELRRHEYRERTLWLYPALRDWMRAELPSLVQLDPFDIAPRAQASALLRAFILGKHLHKVRQFRHLHPNHSDVWELKSPDVRIFGWFCRRNDFIAVCANSVERCKNHELYLGYLNEVVRARDQLDLDPPKWTPGAGYDDVISN